MKLIHLPFLTTFLIAVLLVLLLTSCNAFPGSNSFATLTPSSVLAFTDTPAGEEPTSTQPTPVPTGTEPPASETPPPASETPPPPTEEAPESMPINPETAPNLQTAGEVGEDNAQTFVWLSSADGDSELALATQNEVVVYEVAPENLVTSTNATTPALLTASGNQQRLAWAAQDNQVHIWEVQNGTETRTIDPGTDPITSLAFSPEGETLASTTSQNQLLIWDAGSGELQQSWEIPSWLTNLSFSPDGARIAGVDPMTFTVYIFNRDTGEQLRSLTWEEHASPALYGAYFSPDWRQIAWVARGTVQLMDVETGELGPALQHEEFIGALDWSPDSRLLVATSGASIEGEFVPAAVIWDTQTGEQVSVLPVDTVATDVGFSPDGTQLAALNAGGAVQLWSVSP